MKAKDLEGQVAPDFSALDERGQMHTLSEYKPRWVVLYFYPRDFTSGCTKEACAFRDIMADLAAKNVVVLGVSKDSIDSHERFVQEHALNFHLLSDERGELRKKYATKGRQTFLIDPQSIVRKVYTKVKPAEHPAQVLSDITSFS